MSGAYPVVVAALTGLAAAALRRVFRRTLGEAPPRSSWWSALSG
jgi:hypothetical protein